jgi:uncharacterized RDD family membrane protein YckC
MVTPSNNSYAPPKSAVADVAAADTGAEKASRGSRLGATFIDGLILTIPFGPSYVMALPSVMSHAKGGAAGTMAPYAAWAAIAGTGGWFYFGLLAAICTLTITAVLVHRNGQTIGKKLVGIKVVRTDESRATLARIFWLRYLVNTLLSMVPFVGSIYGLVDVLMIFGAAKRCCHDYIADTIVIRA